MALSATPALNRKPRRETPAGEVCCAGSPTKGMIFFISLFSSFPLCCYSCLSVRDEPRHHIGDVLGTQRPAGKIRAPIRLAQVRPSGDDRRAQRLVTDESKVGWVSHRPAFGSPAAVRTVALRAIGRVRRRAVLCVTRARARSGRLLNAVGREHSVLEFFRTRPPYFHLFHQDVDLLVGEAAPGRLGESRHAGPGHPAGDHPAQRVLPNQSQIERVVERTRRTQTPISAVTTGA